MSDSSPADAVPALAIGPVSFRPRLGTVLAAAAGLLVFLTSAEAWLRSAPLAGQPMQFALADERDDYGHVAHEVQNFGTPGQPDIIVVGTSALREGLLAAPIMERQLRDRFGPAVRFHNLSTFDQTPTEALALVAAAPLTSATVVVVEIKPRRLAHSAAELRNAYTAVRLPTLPDDADLAFLRRENLIDRLHAPSLWRHRAWLRHFVEARIDPRLRDGLADLAGFRCGYACLQRLVTTPWFRVPRRYLAYAYPDLSLPDDELRSLRKQAVAIRIPEFLRNHDLDTDAIAAVIDWAKSRGATVLLVDPPRHPYSVAAYAPVDAVYRRDVAALMAHGAAYLDLARTTQIGPADFYDLDHVRPSGRAILSRLLLEAVGGLFSGVEARIRPDDRGVQ